MKAQNFFLKKILPVMSLCWLRKGLRLHDNLSLLAASKEASEKKTFLMVLFLLDKNLVNLASPNRLRFLHESLIDIEQSLKKKSQRLVVVNVDDFVDSRVKGESEFLNSFFENIAIDTVFS